jgi:hypothetical protein
MEDVMLRHRFILMVLALPFGPLSAPSQERKSIAEHVVVISIDGLRPDAIPRAPATRMLELIKAGAFCPKARAVQPLITLPSQVSMLTGLDCPRHKVLHDEYKPGCVASPTMMSIAKEGGRSTAMFFAKDKFHYLVRAGSVDLLYANAPGKSTCDTSTEGIVKAFEEQWSDKQFSLAFVHIVEPDEVGHFNPENSTIPWICVGARVRAGLIITRGVRVYDTAATALALLGLPMPKIIDGRVVAEILTK